MFAWCRRTADSRLFHLTILIVILLNAVLVGLETSHTLMRDHSDLFDGLNLLVQIIFVAELCIRFLGYHPGYHKFFTNGWNLFDLLVIGVSFLPAVGPFATVARVARVIRVTRLVEFSWELRLIVDTMLRSIPSMGHVVLMLGLLIYVYGVLGVHLFHEVDEKRWGNIGVASWTMFQTITFENWVGLQDPVIERYPWAWFYFFSFIILGVFVGINLFVAVVMNNLEEVKAEHAREKKLPADLREILTRVQSLKSEMEELEVALQKISEGEKKA